MFHINVIRQKINYFLNSFTSSKTSEILMSVSSGKFLKIGTLKIKIQYINKVEKNNLTLNEEK